MPKNKSAYYESFDTDPQFAWYQAARQSLENYDKARLKKTYQKTLLSSKQNGSLRLLCTAAVGVVSLLAHNADRVGAMEAAVAGLVLTAIAHGGIQHISGYTNRLFKARYEPVVDHGILAMGKYADAQKNAALEERIKHYKGQENRVLFKSWLVSGLLSAGLFYGSATDLADDAVQFMVDKAKQQFNAQADVEGVSTQPLADSVFSASDPDLLTHGS